MFATRNLKANGHVELHRALSGLEANRLRSLARSEDFWLPDTWDGVLIDEYRSRPALPDDTARDLTVGLEKLIKTFFPVATPGEWEFVKTRCGAQDQLVRREYAPVRSGRAALDVCSLPGSVLIALEDNTFLYGYGWNHHVAMQSKRNLIRLNKGDLILFRGDFIFSLVGYQRNNVCVHGILDTPRYTRQVTHLPEFVAVEDDTRPADERSCFVWNCPFRSSGADSLRKHLNRYHGMFFNAVRPTLE